jgi:hypothetical protein
MAVENDFGVSRLPNFKRIGALIPQELFDEMKRQGVMENFDVWVAQAILLKLKTDKEEV